MAAPARLGSEPAARREDVMAYRFSKPRILAARCLERLAYAGLRLRGLARRAPPIDGSPPNIVLLVEPFQLGDVLSLTVLFSDLRRQWPAAAIWVLTQEKNRALLELDPRVERVIGCPVPWSGYRDKAGTLAQWRALLRILRDLRTHSIDVGLDLRGEVRNHVLLALSGCRRRVGYTNYMGSNMTLSGLLLTDNLGNLPAEHRYLLNRRLLAHLLPNPLEALTFPTFQVSGIPPLRISGTRRQVIVHTGGGWEFKRWEERRWLSCIRRLASEADCLPVLVGAASEQPDLERLHRELEGVPHEVRVTSIEELVALLRGADLFLGLDSGPMNLAVTLGVPVVALFGPGDSTLWYPMGTGDRYLHARDGFPCNPCFQRHCVVPERSCMSVLEVDDVMEAVQARLAGPHS